MMAEFPRPCMLREASSDKKTSKRRPQCIAHRGFMALWPENTMKAFEAAIAAGAHAIETDVHLTQDNHVVLSHDSSLKRCYGVDRLIADCTLDELSTLRTIREPHLQMPHLQEFLQFMDKPEYRSIWILLDIKTDDDPELLLGLIAKMLDESCWTRSETWESRILLGCWTEQHMVLAAKYLPKFSVTYIAYSTAYASPVFRHENVSCVAVQKILAFWPAGPLFMRKLRAAQQPLMAWMANSETSIRWCIQNDLEGVVTNDPRLFLELCQTAGVEHPQKLGFVQWLISLGIYLLGLLYGFFIFERRARQRKKQSLSL